MPTGYGYGNARLRAMRSRLLAEADYVDLLAKTKIEDLISALTETLYQEDVEAALVRREGIGCIFEAVRTNLTRKLRQIRGFFEGNALSLVDLLLRRWDRHNLLAILRAQSQEISPEVVLATIIPVGQLDEVSLREVARQPGLRAAIDLMVTWRLPYARVLRQAQAKVLSISDFDQLELSLNQFHYASLWEALEPGNRDQAIMLQHLQTEVDLINISTALRLARMPGVVNLVSQRYNAAGVQPLFVESRGHLPVDKLAKLVAESNGMEGMILGLSDTRYARPLSVGWQRYKSGKEGPTVLERELERWQAEQTAAMFTRNPLSIAIPIGYIGCKEIEVTNLRLIAQAINLDMNRTQVRRDLIIV